MLMIISMLNGLSATGPIKAWDWIRSMCWCVQQSRLLNDATLAIEVQCSDYEWNEELRTLKLGQWQFCLSVTCTNTVTGSCWLVAITARHTGFRLVVRCKTKCQRICNLHLNRVPIPLAFSCATRRLLASVSGTMYLSLSFFFWKG